MKTLLLLCLAAGLSWAYIVEPGPVVKATRGEVWPKPLMQVVQQGFLVVKPYMFRFQVTNFNCSIVQQAIARYSRIIRKPRRGYPKSNANPSRSYKYWKKDSLFRGNLDVLQVNLTAPCEHMPYLNMDEAYEIHIQDGVAARLESGSVWGILRGLETFSQLLTTMDADNFALKLNLTEIFDSPRFSHRGILLDTSRHFISLSKILKLLDAMSYNKLNVFHWHIVDDHSFPYESVIFPTLSEKGAFYPTYVYSQSDVAKVIAHATARGIRVMPEFDTPGHTRSWGVAYPELLTQCYTQGAPDGTLGPIDPSKNHTYEFLEQLLEEVVDVFPDKYLHLGGDEVGFECWQSNPEITKYMRANNITGYNQLEEVYIQRLVDMVDKLNASSVVWQEVFENGVRLPGGTVVHVWTGNQREKLSQITKSGLPAFLSTCWYLDHLSTGGDWEKFYNCDPHDFPGTVEQKNLVLGGEACMWSEVVDGTNFMQRIWPRASATAEKLWSPQTVNDPTEAARRLEEHTCRMIARGIPAQPPNGPGFCVV